MKYKYKVVKRKTRISAMLNGNSKYARLYINGFDVYSDENTEGIMVFRTLTEARRWADMWNDCSWLPPGGKDLIVLRVIPIGRGKGIRFLTNDITTDGLDEYYSGNNAGIVAVPDGTTSYPGVHVVKQVE